MLFGVELRSVNPLEVHPPLGSGEGDLERDIWESGHRVRQRMIGVTKQTEARRKVVKRAEKSTPEGQIKIQLFTEKRWWRSEGG